jgi:hypothetical protein
MNCKLIVLTILATAAFAQTKVPSVLKVWFADGTGLDVQTISTGASLPVSTSGSESVTEGYDYHRIVFDKQGVILLGYDIEARRAPLGMFAIRIKPTNTEQVRVGGQGAWLQIPTISGIREFPPLSAGDSVEVDILYNQGTKERIYDVLRVSGGRMPSAKTAKAAGGRFSLEDVRVSINDKTIVQQRGGTWMIGGGFMIYLPGRGEFYFSLSQSPEFPLVAAGWADHNILRFHAGSELIEITGKSNVLQKSVFGTVWMRHVPEEPSNRARDRSFEFRCSDDVESLIRMYNKKAK